MKRNMLTVGTCSICGGPVHLPIHWAGIVPPPPKCSRCGASMARPFGPILEMVPAHTEMPVPGNPGTEEAT